MAKKKTLLLQPVRGKFVQSIVHGRIVRVWLVDPETNETGTEIEYNDAITLLSLPHPVVCPAQIKGKDGKFVNLLTDEDKKLIEEKKSEFASGTISASTSQPGDAALLQKLVETQSQVIKSQEKRLEDMDSKFAAMQKTMEKLLKKAEK